MDYTVPEVLQVRILEWVAIPFSRGSSQPRDRTRSPALRMDSLLAEPQGKPKNTGVDRLSSPGDLPDPGIEPESPVLQADSLPPELCSTKCFLQNNFNNLMKVSDIY